MGVKVFVFMSVICVSVSMMTGGWRKETNTNSEEMKKYAKFATAKVSASSNSIHHMKLTEISDVQKQLVAGMNYRMTITMAPTECGKHGNDTLVEIDDCALLPCGAPTTCNVTVWVRAWLGNQGTKLTESSCSQGNSTC